MNIEKRITVLANWGQVLGEFGKDLHYEKALAIIGEQSTEKLKQIILNEKQFNAWFTSENVRLALINLAEMLQPSKLEQWVSEYPKLTDAFEKNLKIGLVMAGNIPLVGFHDLISVLICGYNAVIRPSSSDNRLLPELLNVLFAIEPDFENRIEWAEEKLQGFDAVIATGSNNTARYFDYYFGKYPNIIRKNRNGVAVLKGTETTQELEMLGHDIFDFFGLGCRNVSKIYLPQGYDLETFFKAIYPYKEIINHHKYANNYDYHRSVFLLNNDDILDNGFLILKKSPELHSPLATLNYEFYADEANLNVRLIDQKESIQCIVSADSIPFGASQKPELWDYADGVDTLAFLTSIKKNKPN